MIPNSNTQRHQSETGVIQGGFGRHFMVQTATGVSRASLAFSCLVVPEPGDKVLLQSADHQLYILAILERTQECETRLIAEGDVSLASRDGSVDIRAKSKVSMASADGISLTSRDVGIASLNTQLHSQKLALRGEQMESQWREVRTITDAWHLVADTMTEKLKNAFRKVDGTNQQTSHNHLQQVDETLSMRSKHAVITSRKDMKIDGERIHMG